MTDLTPAQMNLLELIADPVVVSFGDPQDPDFNRLRELGLADVVIAQRARWSPTAAGRELLEKRRPVGICSTCRTIQRRMDDHTVVCELGHPDVMSLTLCAACSELDCRGIKAVCGQGIDIDPPPAPFCEHWRFSSTRDARLAAIAIWGP